ncbi:MAG TPA: hypothetical protein PK926_01535 [Spirochaetota bacterium]|nr:hypothetical protein [Spirochaetota bacterium]HPI88060.1 hypothetical protein [Spirochaetota bacterium]HPR46455.1 hypothetical protein [Spirochaetota bacterium]
MKLLKITLLSLIFSTLIQLPAFPLSTAAKAQNDYNFTLDKIRVLYIIIENFGNDEIKSQYNQVKSLFQESGESLYGQNYFDSYEKFRKLKTELIILFEKLAVQYLKRTKTILDSTAKNSFDILINYSKKGGLAAYFTRAYDPLKDVKPYDEKEYHLFYNREYIENYMKEGYKQYHRAKNIFNDPEIEYTKKRKNLPSESLNFIISQYSTVIDVCRESKQYGVEIYKILNNSKLGESIIKYNIRADRIDPVFDGRIPDEYKVDANDNLKLIHSVELKKIAKYQQ